jgi:dipeptidyl aminopeptidase/acylaminoacyl peptidase
MADQLQGHLLIQHGTADTNSYLKWTMDFVAALAQVGKPVDLMILPDQAHNFGSSASYVENARIEYLRSHLQNVGTGQGR